MSKRQNFFFSSEIWGHFIFTFCRYLKSEYEGIYLLQVLPAKSICWCHLILMKKMPFDYDWFCPLKMMAFMIIKGNIICWHFLKAFTFCRYFPLYSEGNNSIFLRQSFFPYNLRAFHTTVYVVVCSCTMPLSCLSVLRNI